MFLQKRLEQKRINKLRQFVTDLVDSLPHSQQYEIELMAGLNTLMTGEDTVTIDSVVNALAPAILPRDALLAVSTSTEGFKVSVKNEASFLKLAALSYVRVGDLEYTISLVSPMMVRVRLTDLPHHVASDSSTSLKNFLALLGIVEVCVIETLTGTYPLPTGSALIVFKSVNSLFARQTVIPGTKIHVVFLDDSSKWEKCIDDANFPFLSIARPESVPSAEVSDDVDNTEMSENTESDVKSDVS